MQCVFLRPDDLCGYQVNAPLKNKVFKNHVPHKGWQSRNDKEADKGNLTSLPEAWKRSEATKIIHSIGSDLRVFGHLLSKTGLGLKPDTCRAPLAKQCPQFGFASISKIELEDSSKDTSTLACYHLMFASVPHHNLSPVLQIKKRRHEDECESSTESEDILFFGEDAAVLHTRPRKIRRLRGRGSISHKLSSVQVPLATLASASLQRDCSTSSAMEGVVNAPFVAPNSHGQTPADTHDGCEQQPPTSQDWWFQDGDVVLAAGSMVFKLHSTVLAAGSGVFADLFALGRPEANEEATSAGAPTIPVHDDANDWLEVLPWLYCGQ